MAACAAWRISHSHFLGGPPVWTAADRDKAIWWQIRQSHTCSTCGTRDEEWDPAAGGHRRAYRVEERVCPGCEVLERAQSQQRDDDIPLRGTQLVLIPRGAAR